MGKVFDILKVDKKNTMFSRNFRSKIRLLQNMSLYKFNSLCCGVGRLETGFLCNNPGYPGTDFVDQTGPELTAIHLPLPPKGSKEYATRNKKLIMPSRITF